MLRNIIFYINIYSFLYQLNNSIYQGAIESVKTAADIYSPIDGTIVEVNDNLGKTPKLLNTHPTTEGWYAKLKADEATLNANTSGLMSEQDYENYLADLKK